MNEYNHPTTDHDNHETETSWWTNYYWSDPKLFADDDEDKNVDNNDNADTDETENSHSITITPTTTASKTSSSSSSINIASVRYNRHKPKWWKQRVGRYVTKPQRRALESMHAYRLVKPPYGEMLDGSRIFPHHFHFHHDHHRPPNGVKDVAVAVDHDDDDDVPIWMEIGFGKGDNLLYLAQRHGAIGFIGVEVHPSSIAVCLQRMQAAIARQRLWNGYQLYIHHVDSDNKDYDCEGHNNSSSEWGQCVSSENTSSFLQNVRLYGGDGIVFLESCLADESLNVVMIPFPDPFPSDKSHRILQVHTIETIYSRLKPHGRLFVATDHAGFHQWARDVVDAWNDLQNLEHHNHNQRRLLTALPVIDRSEWLPIVSRYEQKGWDEGRQTLLSGWKKL